LIAPMNGNLRRMFAAVFEKGHAVTSTRHEQRSQLHRGQRRAPAPLQLIHVLSDHRVVNRFELGFVRGRKADAGARVSRQTVSRVQRDWNFVSNTPQRFS